jgi:hypothetical protein
MKLFSLFSSPTGFGTAGIRKHRICGAVTVLGSGNAQYGVEVPEVGISVKNFTVRYYPEIDVPILDNVGEIRGRVKSNKVSREVTIEGEVTGATGVMAFGFLTACIPANDVSDFGDNTGTLLLQEVTITQSRAEWRMYSAKLMSSPGLVI